MGFKEALKYKFGEKDPEGKARMKLEVLRQATDSVTEYWNQFRLIAMEVNMDDGTLQRQFLRGLSPRMQGAWGQDNSRFGSLSELAHWASEKECHLATLKNIKSGRTVETRQQRRDNGTFKPVTTR